MTGVGLEPWADLGRLDPLALSVLLDPPAPRARLDQLTAVSARLPRGLVHAEAVHVVPAPPAGGARLAPGSDWYAVERDLVFVLDHRSPDGLRALLEDLAAYAGLSRQLADAGRADPALVDAAGPDAAGPARVRLLTCLGTEDPEWQRLDESAPGLRDDVQAMLRGPFGAPIHLHPHVRPGWLADAGRAWAEELRLRYPADRPWLLISDGSELVEILSPFVRDLTAALGQWAVENPEHVRLPGLRQAWSEAPDEDLAGLVVPDLLRAEGGLLEERRANERTQGLFLEDRAGVQAGFVEIGRLAAPDRRAIKPEASGHGLIVAGGPGALRAAMVSEWLKRPVAGIAATFSVGGASRPVLPEVVADPGDAFALPGTPRLVAEAAELGIEISTPEVLELPDRRAAATSVLGAVRRGQLCGHHDANLPIFVAFMPEETTPGAGTLDHRLAAFHAGRLVLRRACSPRVEPGSTGPKVPRNPGNDAVPRRFRA